VHSLEGNTWQGVANGVNPYKNTIQKLIEATDKEIPRRGVASYTEAVPKRGYGGIKTSVDSVGWKSMSLWVAIGLFKAIPAQNTGVGCSQAQTLHKKLQQCLNVIHRDIIAVWNICDSNAVHFIRCVLVILLTSRSTW